MEEHLEEQHAEELEPIRERQLRGDGPNALLSIYNQAVSCKCRQQAPIAGPSLDRTALRSFTNAMAKDRVQTLACFSCGGLHPYVEEVADKGEIQWHRPLQRAGPDDGLTFLGQPLAKIKELLGLQAYLAKYNVVSEANAEGAPDIRLTDHESFEDWTVKLPGLADSALLCCPEDRPRQSKSLPFPPGSLLRRLPRARIGERSLRALPASHMQGVRGLPCCRKTASAQLRERHVDGLQLATHLRAEGHGH